MRVGQMKVSKVGFPKTGNQKLGIQKLGTKNWEPKTGNQKVGIQKVANKVPIFLYSRGSLDSSNCGQFLAKKTKKRRNWKQNVPHKRPILGCK
jgi:hypothetical protein